MDGSLDWHPLAMLFPIPDGDEWNAFRDSIKATGGNADDPVTYRMVNGRKQGLDGRLREKACVEIGCQCHYRKVFMDDDKVAEFIIRKNLRRRHLTAETRQGLVKALRESGMSQARVAKALGVNQATVSRDENNLPVGSADYANAYSQKIRKKRKKPGKTGSNSKNHSDEGAEEGAKEIKVVSDFEGHEVPLEVAEVFSDPAIEECLTHCRAIQKLIDEVSNRAAGAELRRFLQPTGSEDKTINKSEHLNALKRDLKGTRPHSVCPWCRGKQEKGCRGCQGRGWVTKTTWASAEDTIKERL
jgi:transposase-like protein